MLRAMLIETINNGGVMFTRKRVKKLEDAVAQIRKQLSCKHDKVEYFYDGFSGGYQRCAECGLTLKHYPVIDDMDKDRAKDKRAEAKRLMEEANDLEGAENEQEQL